MFFRLILPPLHLPGSLLAVVCAGVLVADLNKPAEAGAGSGAGQRASGGQGGVRHPGQTSGAAATAGLCPGLPQRKHGAGQCMHLSLVQ